MTTWGSGISWARESCCAAAIEADRISSIILVRPAGRRKNEFGADHRAIHASPGFERISGVEGNVADIRRVVALAANRLENSGEKTILFIDEIHRFNKAQQDVLSAGRGERTSAPDWRHHPQPVFLRQ